MFDYLIFSATSRLFYALTMLPFCVIGLITFFFIYGSGI